MRNAFYFGDNLHILRDYVADESVDLIYLDPPFNSNATYNLLFRSPDRSRWSDAQIATFEDSWSWGEIADAQYRELIRTGGRASELMVALHRLLGPSDMLAYLTMMAARLVELRRVLKPTGSLYLHCDPTASHYLKILLDGLFGADRFRNEIIWQRTSGKALMTRRLPTNHDTLLSYQRSDTATWNASAIYQAYDIDNLPPKIAAKYSHRDPDGRRYQLDNLINPNADRPNLTYEFLGVTRVWRWTRDRMQEAYERGIVVQTGPGKVPRLKRYLTNSRACRCPMSGRTSLR